MDLLKGLNRTPFTNPKDTLAATCGLNHWSMSGIEIAS